MISSRLLAAVLGSAALLSVTAAHADGMPYGSTQPARQQALTPLDQALDQLQGPSPLMAEDEDLILEEEPPQLVEPAPPPPVVPENRVVEVQENTSFFGLSVGMYDAFTHGEKSAAFNIEWQPGTRIAGMLQPLFGAMVTTDGAMMGYGGVGIPFNVTDRIMLMPSVALGYYKDGRGVDLDSSFAVRYGTEIAYQFENQSRVGLNAHIISNGKSFDRKDRTEVISVVYTTPTNLFSGSAAPQQPAASMLNARMAPPPAQAAAAIEPAAGGNSGLQTPPGMRINR